MVITKKATIPGCNIQINGRALKQVEQFKYLGTLITQDGRCETEVKARIAQAKSAFVKMKSLLTNKSIGLEIRKKILRCYIEPILLYGCEAWTLTKKIIGYLEGAEMWFFRRMLRVAWSDKKSNLDVLKMTNAQRALIGKVQKRKSTLVGHIVRKERIENLIITGKMEGKRSRGRQRKKMLDDVGNWLGMTKMTEMLEFARRKEVWNDMIAHATRHGT